MVIVHAGLGDDAVGLVIVQVHHAHLRRVQATTAHAATEATAATTAEAHVVGVVAIQHGHHAVVALHHHAEDAARIAVLRAHAQVDVHHLATVHALSQAEVEHRLLIAVIDAGDAAQVALLVVGTDALHDVGGQVLQRSLRVAELLVVHLDLAHRLTVDLDVAVVVHLGTGQALHQLLHHRALGGLEGIGIIYQRVALRLHAGNVLHHLDALQHLGVDFNLQRAQLHGAAAHRHGAEQRLVAHVGDAQQEAAVARSRHLEHTVQVGHGVGHQRAVLLLQQGHRGLNHRFLTVFVNHRAAQRSLSTG